MLIVFDLDGTLADTMPLHIEAFINVMEKDGYKLDKKKTKESINGFRGMTGERILQILAGKKDIKDLYEKKKKYIMERANRIKETKGATKVLKKLEEKGYKIAVVTSSRRDFADMVINKFGWKFDMLVTADDVKNPKPHTEPYQKVLDKLGKPDLVVGDGINDEIPAKSLGLRFLRFGRDIKKLDRVFDYLG
jgi:pyrophosphatase PpaX